MSKKLSFSVLPLILFVVLLGFLLKGLFSDPRERDSALINKPVPDFQLPDLMDESVIHTAQTLSTSPVLINVWGTWCTTCKYELPYLELNIPDDPALFHEFDAHFNEQGHQEISDQLFQQLSPRLSLSKE